MSVRRKTRYEKILLTPGKYGVVKNGSTTEEDEFTPERLIKIAATGNLMRKNGLNIPIPFKHFDASGHAPKPVVISDTGKEFDPITGKAIDWDASINGGFTEEFFINEEGALGIRLDSFGDPEDHTSPAGKMGTTVQETSIGLAKVYRDGKGNIYEDAPVHIAACIKAVEPGQSNFVLLSENEAAKVTGDLSIVSMSSQLSTMASMDTSNIEANHNKPIDDESDPEIGGENLTCDIPSLLELLRKLDSPIDLPGDTTIENLVERLCISVNQKICDEESDEQIEPGEGDAKPEPPKQAQEKSGYTTMSNPAGTTPAPVQLTQPSEESLLLMSMLAGQHKSNLQTRIDALKKKGVKDETIAKHVLPHLEMDLTTMSLSDFDRSSGKVKSLEKAELAISVLEDMEITTMDLSGSIGYDPNYSEVGYTEANQMTDEEKEATANFMAVAAGGGSNPFNPASLANV